MDDDQQNLKAIMDNYVQHIIRDVKDVKDSSEILQAISKDVIQRVKATLSDRGFVIDVDQLVDVLIQLKIAKPKEPTQEDSDYEI